MIVGLFQVVFTMLLVIMSSGLEDDYKTNIQDSEPGYCTGEDCDANTKEAPMYSDPVQNYPVTDDYRTVSKAIQGNTESEKKIKKVLFWTNFFEHYDYKFGFGQKPFLDAKCPVSNCMTTKEKSTLSEADAVVFHMRNVQGMNSIPKERKQNQRFVFFLLEPPHHHWNDLKLFANVFNLTMSYRMSSDAPMPYGKVVPFVSSGPMKELNIKQRKPVAWFVSNCQSPSKRELYAKELAKYIDVELYGNCGEKKCPEGVHWHQARMNLGCYEMMENKYNFYLSFENNWCEDYVTEKLFFILQYNVIPIVYGAVNYTKVTPPNSVINVADFKSPNDLANYLKHLIDHKDEYEKYFEWKKHHKVVLEDQYKDGFCKLCEILNDPEYPNQIYHDIDGWWGKERVCQKNIFQDIRQKGKW